MSKTIRQFSYDIVKMGKAERLPFNPIVTIRLDHYSKNKDGMPAVSPHLMTEEEIEYHIQALKDDLDAVGKNAKSALRKAIEEARCYKSN